MRGGPLLAALLNVLALSAIIIGNVGWKCRTGYDETARRFMSDAPWSNDDSDDPVTTTTMGAPKIAPSLHVPTSGWEEEYEPSHLKWDASPVDVPPDWRYEAPRSCGGSRNITNFDSSQRKGQKIIVHYHMQHNAGTNFFAFAAQFAPCATRACWQDAKHCFVSWNEEAEAENIRQNYERHGVQYVSYEVMLPPRFPLPFVSETARQGLFFTTIVRDPFKRFLTHVRRSKGDKNFAPNSPFWKDMADKQLIYSPDNLNARWLSGAQESRISSDHVNVAKCRLQLFDLVIADKLYDFAVQGVMCKINGWKGGPCKKDAEKKEHASKADPLEGITNPHVVGAWVERLRPSFEIYDYARILSLKQLKKRGVRDLPELSAVPSYVDTLARYVGAEVSDAYFKRIRPVTLEREEEFAPPVEFCERMKRVWTSNPDEVPNVYGIGTIMNGFHPKLGKN